MREQEPLKSIVDTINDNSASSRNMEALFTQFLDESLDHQVRIIHLEQEREDCRIRRRAGGLLSEQKINSDSLVRELKIFLQQKFSCRELKDSLHTQMHHRQVECYLTCECYETTSGLVLILQIFHERNIPDTLEQTSLDHKSISLLREQINQLNGGLMIISSRSDDQLCDLYYPLLNELTQLDQKVLSFESTQRKNLPRINQVINNALFTVPQDSSTVFIDWETVRNTALVNDLIERYRTTVVFIQANSLSAAVRQLSDIAISERQLATSLQGMIEIGQVRLICPHCASAYQPGKSDMPALERRGIDPTSTLNYASGCDACQHTGHGKTKTLIAQYPINDLVRNKIESRQSSEIEAVLATSTTTSVQTQRNCLMSQGAVGWNTADND